jgi:hypothetical protein
VHGGVFISQIMAIQNFEHAGHSVSQGDIYFFIHYHIANNTLTGDAPTLVTLILEQGRKTTCI